MKHNERMDSISKKDLKRARGDFNTFSDKIQDMDDKTAGNTSRLSDLAKTTQDLKRNPRLIDFYNSNRSSNKQEILVKKIDFNNIKIFIHHAGQQWQGWGLTRNTGLDNSIASNENGDAWQVNVVTNDVIGALDEVLVADFTTLGSWTNYSGTIVSSSAGDYVEATVTGNSVVVSGTFRDDGGIANISIDGNNYGFLDFYALSTGGLAKSKVAVEGLSSGEHIVRLTVSGTKNSSSSGNSIRISAIKGYSSIDVLNEVEYTNEEVIFDSTKRYRYGQSAIELAINSTYNGSTVWSGSYHKNMYPSHANNQSILIDGYNVDIDNMSTGFTTCYDFSLSQELKLYNSEDIADILLFNHFTRNGYHVKWKLEWLKDVLINTSYDAMFGTSVDRMIFGNFENGINIAVYDDSDKGDYDTFEMLGWNSEDDYVAVFSSNNIEFMKYENVNKYMYYRDRTTDMKMYKPKFKGFIESGEKWKSDFIVSIAKCSDAESKFNF